MKGKVVIKSSQRVRKIISFAGMDIVALPQQILSVEVNGIGFTSPKVLPV